MGNCRICHNPVPLHQTFCSNCGARQIADSTRGVAKQGIFMGLKNFLKGLFRSEREKEAERHLEVGFNLGQFGFEDALDDHEKAVCLYPSDVNKSILATTYLGAADERLGLMSFGGPLHELDDNWNLWGFKSRGERKAEEILSWVSKVRQHEGQEFLQYHEAYEGLDKALDGALAMYDLSIRMNPAYSRRAYSRRALAFYKVAHGILWAYGIFTNPLSTDLVKDLEGKRVVRYGSLELGICYKEKVPDLQFAEEILWLYKHAEEDYQTALRLDPTDADSYVGLSHVQQNLGKAKEATENLNKALAILNSAIQADNTDERSYSKRAQIFEEIDKIDLAIADLELALTFLTRQYDIDFTRRRIEALRKRKEATGKE